MNIWQFQMLVSMKNVKWKEKGFNVSLKETGVVEIEGDFDEVVISKIKEQLRKDKYLMFQQNGFQRIEIHDAESFSYVLDILSEVNN